MVAALLVATLLLVSLQHGAVAHTAVGAQAPGRVAVQPAVAAAVQPAVPAAVQPVVLAATHPAVPTAAQTRVPVMVPTALARPAAQPAAPPQAPVAEAVVETNQTFDDWLDELVLEARGRGISDGIISQTLVGLEPLARVIQSDRSQAEAQPGFGRYLASRLTPLMLSRGRDMARAHGPLLDRIEREFGVQRRFLLAIWGIETNFGRNTGNTPLFRALATLAWEPRRAAFFRTELFNALEIASLGLIDVKTMTGSWAGAMGQPQFMPSSYLKFAVDFDGDGRRDIWSSTPDALASMANYLKGHGWDGEYTWGREVRVSPALVTRIRATVPLREGGCSARRTMTEFRPLAEWQALGVRLADGRNLPSTDITASFVDAGERQFLVYGNYDAILGYNCSHYYALSVALLAEALR